MNSPTVLKELRALIASNQIPKPISALADDFKKYEYSEAIAQLKDLGYMSLEDMQKLSLEDLNNLFEEIKRWCVYGNHDPKKLLIANNTINS